MDLEAPEIANEVRKESEIRRLASLDNPNDARQHVCARSVLLDILKKADGNGGDMKALHGALQNLETARVRVIQPLTLSTGRGS